MRKTWKWIAFILAISLLAGAVPALADEPATLSVDAPETLAGEEVELQVSLRNNPGLCSFRLKVEFDRSILSPVKNSGDLPICEAGTLLAGRGGLYCSEQSYGCLVFWSGVADCRGDGVLFSLRLRVLSNTAPGEYPVTLVSIAEDAVNVQEEPVALSCENGAVRVRSFLPLIYGETAAVNQGDIVEYAIRIRDNPGIASCMVGLTFDSKRFELVHDELSGSCVVPSEGGFSAGQFVCRELSAYAAVVNWFSGSNCDEDGAVFSVLLRAKTDAAPGESGVAVQCAQILNQEEQPVSFTAQNGTLTVRAVQRMSVVFSAEHTAELTITNSEAAYVILAFYSPEGKMAAVQLCTISDGGGNAVISAPGISLSEFGWRVFSLDETWTPISASAEGIGSLT